MEIKLFVFRKKSKQSRMGIQNYLKTRKTEHNFKKIEIFPKNLVVLYARVNICFVFFSKKRVKALERSSVGGNL